MIEIRPIEISDAEKFAVLQRELAKETKFMMRELEECTMEAEHAKQMIENVRKSNNFLFVAEVEGEIVGFASASKGAHNRIRHCAYIVTGIRSDYQGQGIGGQFFSELDKWATDEKLRRFELTVMTHNLRAKSLYEKNGFVIEGIKRDSMCVDGEYVDEYYMGKILEY